MLPWSTSSRRALSRSVTLLAGLMLSSAITPAPAHAHQRGPCDIATDESECARVADGTIVVGSQRGYQRKRPSQARADERGGSPTFADALNAFCADARANAARSGGPLPPEVAALCAPGTAAPVLTPGMVLRAFRELPLYRGAIRTDPAGWTLVNLDTYFWCAEGSGLSCADVGEPERVVTLLGRRVRIRPHVVSYTWQFGDGATQKVGAGPVRHVYLSKRTAVVTVTLTWSAEYSVGGGPFQPIGGTTTTTSAPLILPVREARPVLVGGDSWRAGLIPSESRTPR
jgi:hypothetical protein